MRRALLAALLLPFAAGACDGGPTTSQRDAAQVALRFAIPSGAHASRAAETRETGAATGGTLTLTGSNGTLTITDARVIVSRVELRRVAGTCSSTTSGVHTSRGADDGGEHTDCAKFRTGARLLSLPLGGGAVTLATDSVPAGTYGSVRFKVEDFDDEHGEMEHETEHGTDDAVESTSLQAVLAEMRTAYPAFPSDASMVVQGTFTPTGGTARPFTVYFRANLHIEKQLNPAIVVPGTQSVDVVVDSSLWFKPGTQVTDLSAVNGRTVRFEAEMEHGFHHAEPDGSHQ
jgi:hypothetical protein